MTTTGEPPEAQDHASILDRRAEALARRDAGRDPRGAASPFLLFEAGGDRLALEVSAVAGVALAAGVTPLPLAPPAVRGVCERRGEITTVIDLAVLLERSTGQEPAAGYLLFLRRGTSPCGLLVSAVDQVAELDASALEPLKNTDGESGPRLLRSLTPDGVAVLDPDALASHPLLAGTTRRPATHSRT